MYYWIVGITVLVAVGFVKGVVCMFVASQNVDALLYAVMSVISRALQPALPAWKHATTTVSTVSASENVMNHVCLAQSHVNGSVNT